MPALLESRALPLLRSSLLLRLLDRLLDRLPGRASTTASKKPWPHALPPATSARSMRS